MSVSANTRTPRGIYTSEAGAREVRQRYEAALAEWPVPAEWVRVPTAQGETFVLVCGPADAPPLVLLHGSGANATMWQGDVATWSRHFRTYAVDLVGEPGLSAPSRPELGSAECAGWLDEVLDGLGVPAAAVVASSLGGWFALDYAIRRPERVTRLALLCPGGVGRQRFGPVLVAVLLGLFGRRGRYRSVRWLTGLGHAPEHRHVLDTVVLTFAHFRPRTERLPIHPDEALRGLAMPVQVTVGDRDALFDSADTVRRVRGCVPHAELHLLSGVGHAVLDRTVSVRDFLRPSPPLPETGVTPPDD